MKFWSEQGMDERPELSLGSIAKKLGGRVFAESKNDGFFARMAKIKWLTKLFFENYMFFKMKVRLIKNALIPSVIKRG